MDHDPERAACLSNVRSEGHCHVGGYYLSKVMFGGPNLGIPYATSMAKPTPPRFPTDGVLRCSLFAIYDLGIRACQSPVLEGEQRGAQTFCWARKPLAPSAVAYHAGLNAAFANRRVSQTGSTIAPATGAS